MKLAKLRRGSSGAPPSSVVSGPWLRAGVGPRSRSETSFTRAWSFGPVSARAGWRCGRAAAGGSFAAELRTATAMFATSGLSLR